MGLSGVESIQKFLVRDAITCLAAVLGVTKAGIDKSKRDCCKALGASDSLLRVPNFDHTAFNFLTSEPFGILRLDCRATESFAASSW
jgi:hypothetical protein